MCKHLFNCYDLYVQYCVDVCGACNVSIVGNQIFMIKQPYLCLCYSTHNYHFMPLNVITSWGCKVITSKGLYVHWNWNAICDESKWAFLSYCIVGCGMLCGWLHATFGTELLQRHSVIWMHSCCAHLLLQPPHWECTDICPRNWMGMIFNHQVTWEQCHQHGGGRGGGGNRGSLPWALSVMGPPKQPWTCNLNLFQVSLLLCFVYAADTNLCTCILS